MVAEGIRLGMILSLLGTPKGSRQVASDTSVRSFALMECPNPPESTVLSLVRGDRAES
jgi:hypothetical protein